MPSITVVIHDEHDTEYTLEVSYDILPAEPDVGLMGPGAEITDVVCDQITMFSANEARIVWDGADMPGEPANLGDWLGEWCWHTFEDAIMEKAATAAGEHEPGDDYDA